MDTLDNYRQLIKEILVTYTQIPYSHAAIECKVVFDSENDSYLLITLGWDGVKRIHGYLVHIDIIDGKIWLQRDDTEDGVTYEFIAAGIPKDQMFWDFTRQMLGNAQDMLLPNLLKLTVLGIEKRQRGGGRKGKLFSLAPCSLASSRLPHPHVPFSYRLLSINWRYSLFCFTPLTSFTSSLFLNN